MLFNVQCKKPSTIYFHFLSPIVCDIVSYILFLYVINPEGHYFCFRQLIIRAIKIITMYILQHPFKTLSPGLNFSVYDRYLYWYHTSSDEVSLNNFEYTSADDYFNFSLYEKDSTFPSLLKDIFTEYRILGQQFIIYF